MLAIHWANLLSRPTELEPAVVLMSEMGPTRLASVISTSDITTHPMRQLIFWVYGKPCRISLFRTVAYQ